MNDTFLILHLSDSHIGNPARKLEMSQVFDPLYKDLRLVSQSYGRPPSLIIFSGDLVYGNIPESKIEIQFCTANEYLTQICKCFDSKLGDIPIMIVPGNHDSNRNLIDKGHKLLREQSLDVEFVQEMMYSNDLTWQRFLEPQNAWLEFVKGIPNQKWELDLNLRLQTGLLKVNKFKIGVAGLNTSWASQDKNDQGRIWVGKRQVDLAYEKIKSADLKIVIGHHPLSWLNAEDKNSIYQKIESSFDIFFHGHDHSQWYSDTPGYLTVAAGPCYAGVKDNGYSWLEIDMVSKAANIRLQEYTAQGKGGWRSNEIPGKTDRSGIAKLIFLEKSQPEIKAELPPLPAKTKRYDGINDFLRSLESALHFRWESGNIENVNNSVVYWPVRLRKPTPIHAAQCFVAAGLQKRDCEVALWVDDLGRQEYPPDTFTSKLKRWYQKVGGNPNKLEVRKFSEILDHDGQHAAPAWKMLQQWLGTMVFYTDHILRVSKIWPATEEPGKVISEFSKRRPRRLMTPSMVWTCLSILYEARQDRSFITLGGYDEKSLWEAWRTCCELPTMHVGHLYVSKLTHKSNGEEIAVHMADSPLAWESEEDIVRAFKHSIYDSSKDSWEQIQSLIPWTINNCVLLPNYVSNTVDSVLVAGRSITKIADLDGIRPSDIVDDLVALVRPWLL